MPIPYPNQALAVSLMAACLASCSAPENAEPEQSEAAPDSSATNGALSADSLVIAETAWLSVSENGEVFTTYLDPDGRFRDMRGGDLVYTGTWEQSAGGDLCFTPASGTGSCWEHRGTGLDGVMRATSRDGRAIEVKRVAYALPPEPNVPETDPAEASDPDMSARDGG